ncbi:MAG: RagB/SusD family nutrient uptake outer membrane protein, partial [Gemmatimonadota bacterium]
NLARVGLARVKMDLKKWAEAATAAALVPAAYEKLGDRGGETDRRWNKMFFFFTDGGFFTVATALRNNPDPRYKVIDTGHGAFTPQIRLFVTEKYPALNTPIRLASYREAQLILAEAKAQQGDAVGALAILNARRAEISLAPLVATTGPEAVTAVIGERQAELAFEGGQRMNDLLRYHLPWKGANGSTKIANEFDGRPYGATVCWPIPTKEVNGA